jgi:hypothetical protein
MTQKELLTAIEALPKELQFAIASSVRTAWQSKDRPRSPSNSRLSLCDGRKRFFRTRIRGKFGSRFARNYSESEPSSYRN